MEKSRVVGRPFQRHLTLLEISNIEPFARKARIWDIFSVALLPASGRGPHSLLEVGEPRELITSY